MSNKQVANAVARIKELLQHYEDTINGIPSGKFDADTRAMIKRLRHDTFQEIKELVKRL